MRSRPSVASRRRQGAGAEQDGYEPPSGPPDRSSGGNEGAMAALDEAGHPVIQDGRNPNEISGFDQESRRVALSRTHDFQ